MANKDENCFIDNMENLYYFDPVYKNDALNLLKIYITNNKVDIILNFVNLKLNTINNFEDNSDDDLRINYGQILLNRFTNAVEFLKLCKEMDIDISTCVATLNNSWEKYSNTIKNSFNKTMLSIEIEKLNNKNNRMYKMPTHLLHNEINTKQKTSANTFNQPKQEFQPIYPVQNNQNSNNITKPKNNPASPMLKPEGKTQNPKKLQKPKEIKNNDTIEIEQHSSFSDDAWGTDYELEWYQR